MQRIQMIEKEHMRMDLPEIKPGYTVKVHQRISEEGKERIQVFQGVVIKVRGSGTNATFTVRKISYGVGVEKIFPFCAPTIEKVEVVSKARVRRAKLYYLRQLRGKAARLKEIRR